MFQCKSTIFSIFREKMISFFNKKPTVNMLTTRMSKMVGYVYTTYDALVTAFGKESGLHDDYKSMHQFDIKQLPGYNYPISIYDWKADFYERGDDFTNDLSIFNDRYYWWHIGAQDEGAVVNVARHMGLSKDQYRYM